MPEIESNSTTEQSINENPSLDDDEFLHQTSAGTTLTTELHACYSHKHWRSLTFQSGGASICGLTSYLSVSLSLRPSLSLTACLGRACIVFIRCTLALMLVHGWIVEHCEEIFGNRPQQYLEPKYYAGLVISSLIIMNFAPLTDKYMKVIFTYPPKILRFFSLPDFAHAAQLTEFNRSLPHSRE